jgi:hypothetical protein
MEQMIALNVGVLTRLTYAGLIATRCNVDDCPFSASYKRWRRCSSHGAYSQYAENFLENARLFLNG